MSGKDPSTKENLPEGIDPRQLGRRLLSVAQAGTYLGISPWTVRERIWAGDLASVRLGRRVLLDIRDLEAFIERNKQTETL